MGGGYKALYMAWRENPSTCTQQENTLWDETPHLAGIHEFGVPAYVKDLKAGTLDACAQVGQFTGYNPEFKGYHIYWTKKKD